MRKKSVVLLSVVLCLVMAMSLFGCGAPAATTPAPAPAAPDAPAVDAPAAPEAPASTEVVKVGWLGSLTGDSAVYGIASSNSVKMFFEDLNKEGGLLGRQVEVICYDTKGDAGEAVNAAKRLTGQDKVIAIIGPNASGHVIALASVMEEMQIPNISEIATNPKATVGDDGKVNPFTYRACFIDPYQGAVAAGFASDTLGVKKAAIFYDISSDYSQGLVQFFEEGFLAKGGEIVAKEAYKTGEVDFRAQLTKIKEAQPEIIFAPFFFKDAALFSKQARELGITATFLGGDGWSSDQLVPMAGDAVEGAYFVTHLDYQDATVKEYLAKYEGKYNMTLAVAAGFLSWDASVMLADAVNRANSLDPIEINKALESCDVQGVTGRIKISADTHNPEGKDAIILQIVDGAYSFVEKYSVQ